MKYSTLQTINGSGKHHACWNQETISAANSFFVLCTSFLNNSAGIRFLATYIFCRHSLQKQYLHSFEKLYGGSGSGVARGGPEGPSPPSE